MLGPISSGRSLLKSDSPLRLSPTKHVMAKNAIVVFVLFCFVLFCCCCCCCFFLFCEKDGNFKKLKDTKLSKPYETVQFSHLLVRGISVIVSLLLESLKQRALYKSKCDKHTHFSLLSFHASQSYLS